MAALLKRRAAGAAPPRSHRAPFYPMFPTIAFALRHVCLVAMSWFNVVRTTFFAVPMALACNCLRVTSAQRAAAAPDATLSS